MFHAEYILLPSSRRFQTVTCKTNHKWLSFVPMSIRLLNEKFLGHFLNQILCNPTYSIHANVIIIIITFVGRNLDVFLFYHDCILQTFFYFHKRCIHFFHLRDNKGVIVLDDVLLFKFHLCRSSEQGPPGGTSSVFPSHPPTHRCRCLLWTSSSRPPQEALARECGQTIQVIIIIIKYNIYILYSAIFTECSMALYRSRPLDMVITASRRVWSLEFVRLLSPSPRPTLPLPPPCPDSTLGC